MDYTIKDLIWAVWYMSETQLHARMDAKAKGTFDWSTHQRDLNRYDAIEAWAIAQMEALQLTEKHKE